MVIFSTLLARNLQESKDGGLSGLEEEEEDIMEMMPPFPKKTATKTAAKPKASTKLKAVGFWVLP